jgi:hypothetical protein
MDPIPLSYKRRVYAWACGRCGKVGDSGSLLGYDENPDRQREAIAELARGSREDADGCCRCHNCATVLPTGETHGYCPTCEARFAVDRDARDREHVARAAALQERNHRAILAAGGSIGAATRLRDEMSDLSESCWCASWLEGCERSLWLMALEPDADHPWGQGTVTAADAFGLASMAKLAGGWWQWDDAAGDPAFVPMAEWLAMVATETPPGGAVGSKA